MKAHIIEALEYRESWFQRQDVFTCEELYEMLEQQEEAERLELEFE